MKIGTCLKVYTVLHVLVLHGSNCFSQTMYDDSMLLKFRDKLEVAVNAYNEKLLLDSRSDFERLLSTDYKPFLVHYYVALADEYLFLYYTDNQKKAKILDDGIKHLEQSIELNDSFAEANILLGSLYGLKIGLTPSLASELSSKISVNMRQAKKLDPNNPRLYLVAGKSAVYKPEAFGGGIAVAKKELSLALQYFGQYKPAYEVYPNWGHAEAYAWLGWISDMENNTIQAEKNFKSALLIDPDYNWVKKYLLPEVVRKKTKGPTLVPEGAHLNSGQTLQIQILHNLSKTIYYTLDGSEPTKLSQLYLKPINVTETVTVKAKAFYDDDGSTNTISAKYYFNGPLSAGKDRDNLKEGLEYQYFEGAWDSLPDIKNSVATKKGIATSIAVRGNLRDDNFALYFNGYLNIAEAGIYKIYLHSDDGSKLYLNDQLLLNHDGLHDDSETKSFIASLKKGFYPLQVFYFEKIDSEKLEVLIEGPKIKKQKIPAVMLYH